MHKSRRLEEWMVGGEDRPCAAALSRHPEVLGQAVKLLTQARMYDLIGNPWLGCQDQH